jgi:signal transduction histidine kinase
LTGPVLDFFADEQLIPKHNFYPTVRDAVAIAMKLRNAYVRRPHKIFKKNYLQISNTKIKTTTKFHSSTSRLLLDEPAERKYNAIDQAVRAQSL